MTVPFIFVCFKINKASDLFLLVPLIIVNLSTDYTYQYNVDYQYVFGSGAMLFCAFVKEVSTLKQKRKVYLYHIDYRKVSVESKNEKII